VIWLTTLDVSLMTPPLRVKAASEGCDRMRSRIFAGHGMIRRRKVWTVALVVALMALNVLTPLAHAGIVWGDNH
jgi:hypothetical protein